jgi:hypothetical protein
MYSYKHYTGARSFNHCYRQKAISVTKSGCVLLAVCYPACKAYAPCYTGICNLPDPTMFLTLSHKLCDFRGKNVIVHKMCALIVSTNLV